MEDAMLVGVVDGAGDSGEDLRGFALVFAEARLMGHQAAAFDEQHAEEMPAAMLADLIKGDDVRMIEPGDGFGFGAEALDFVLAAELIPANHLQGHDAIELALAGLVDDAHSADAELFQE